MKYLVGMNREPILLLYNIIIIIYNIVLTDYDFAVDGDINDYILTNDNCLNYVKY